ncbi:MAG: 30S ribosome-binding factor RbfA [Candidatus Omnitrophica bacterium]|nr:30S ribosome-binding factor RbfA [Candidatus Omnitrophota bacterium]MCM8827770.1 30S ribosome-binding factor RbfA [Candidatus Omnitrophota bacterium]
MSFDIRNRKNLKFASILKHQINEILQKGISDPRIGFVTITDVRVSSDRKHATVFVSALGNQEQQEESLKGLANAAGYVRHLLGKKLETRFTPEIEFVRDENPGLKIEEILREMKEKGDNEG